MKKVVGAGEYLWGLAVDGTIKQIEIATEAVTDVAGDASADISIGPDGSIYIITDQGELKR